MTRRAARLAEPCAGNPLELEFLGNSRDKGQVQFNALPTPTMTAVSPRAIARCKISLGKAPPGEIQHKKGSRTAITNKTRGYREFYPRRQPSQRNELAPLLQVSLEMPW